MKKLMFFVLGIILVAAATATIILMNSKTVESQTVDAGGGQEFFLNTSVGREIIINLNANSTTGYSWTEEYDNSYLKLTDAQYTISANTTGLAGSGGIQTYHFKALKRGQTTLTLTYKRPWENQSIDTKVFNVTIN